jgi:hypothetical protein
MSDDLFDLSTFQEGDSPAWNARKQKFVGTKTVQESKQYGNPAWVRTLDVRKIVGLDEKIDKALAILLRQCCEQRSCDDDDDDDDGTGIIGSDGAQGGFGGNSLAYVFSSQTADADPEQGKLRLNNATMANVSRIYICVNDAVPGNRQAWLAQLDLPGDANPRGQLRIVKQSNSAVFAIFNVTGVSDWGGSFAYLRTTVEYVTHSGSFADGDSIFLCHQQNGERGGNGLDGDPGADGEAGPQGQAGVTYTPVANQTLLWSEFGSSDLTYDAPGNFGEIDDSGSSLALGGFPGGCAGVKMDGTIQTNPVSMGFRRPTGANLDAVTTLFEGTLPTTGADATELFPSGVTVRRLVGGWFRFHSDVDMADDQTTANRNVITMTGELASTPTTMAIITAHQTRYGTIRLALETNGGTTYEAASPLAEIAHVPNDTWVWIGLVWQATASGATHAWRGVCAVANHGRTGSVRRFGLRTQTSAAYTNITVKITQKTHWTAPDNVFGTWAGRVAGLRCYGVNSLSTGEKVPTDISVPVDVYPPIIIDPIFGSGSNTYGPWQSLATIFNSSAFFNSWLISPPGSFVDGSGIYYEYEQLRTREERVNFCRLAIAGGVRPAGHQIRLAPGVHRTTGMLLPPYTSLDIYAVRGLDIVADDPANWPVVSLNNLIAAGSGNWTVHTAGVWKQDFGAISGSYRFLWQGSDLKALLPFRLSDSTARIAAVVATEGSFCWHRYTDGSGVHNVVYVNPVGGVDPDTEDYEYSANGYGISAWRGRIKNVIFDGGGLYNHDGDPGDAMEPSPQIAVAWDDNLPPMAVIDSCIMQRAGRHAFAIYGQAKRGLAVVTNVECRGGPIDPVDGPAMPNGIGFSYWSPFVDYSNGEADGEIVVYYYQCRDYYTVVEHKTSEFVRNPNTTSFLSHGELDSYEATVVDSCEWNSTPAGSNIHKRFTVRSLEPTVHGQTELWIDDSVTAQFAITVYSQPIVYLINSPIDADPTTAFTTLLPPLDAIEDCKIYKIINQTDQSAIIHDENDALDLIDYADEIMLAPGWSLEIQRRDSVWGVIRFGPNKDSYQVLTPSNGDTVTLTPTSATTLYFDFTGTVTSVMPNIADVPDSIIYQLVSRGGNLVLRDEDVATALFWDATDVTLSDGQTARIQKTGAEWSFLGVMDMLPP